LWCFFTLLTFEPALLTRPQCGPPVHPVVGPPAGLTTKGVVVLPAAELAACVESPL
jgi:hypothetical protein